MDNRKSWKHTNFHQMLWFCQNAQGFHEKKPPHISSFSVVVYSISTKHTFKKYKAKTCISKSVQTVKINYKFGVESAGSRKSDWGGGTMMRFQLLDTALLEWICEDAVWAYTTPDSAVS